MRKKQKGKVSNAYDTIYNNLESTREHKQCSDYEFAAQLAKTVYSS